MREPEGIEPFLRSYNTNPAGHYHEVIIVKKGNKCKGVHDMKVPSFGRDLYSYRLIAERLKSFDWLMFFNSHSVINRPGWLKIICDIKSQGPSLVGTSRSLESFYTNRPTWWRKLLFPPYPNFHLRTNGFMISREIMLAIWPKFVLTKWQAYLFESGWNSLTRRIRELGLQAYDLSHLGLISDNQTCKNKKVDEKGKYSLC